MESSWRLQSPIILVLILSLFSHFVSAESSVQWKSPIDGDSSSYGEETVKSSMDFVNLNDSFRWKTTHKRIPMTNEDYFDSNGKSFPHAVHPKEPFHSKRNLADDIANNAIANIIDEIDGKSREADVYPNEDAKGSHFEAEPIHSVLPVTKPPNTDDYEYIEVEEEVEVPVPTTTTTTQKPKRRLTRRRRIFKKRPVKNTTEAMATEKIEEEITSTAAVTKNGLWMSSEIRNPTESIDENSSGTESSSTSDSLQNRFTNIIENSNIDAMETSTTVAIPFFVDLSASSNFSDISFDGDQNVLITTEIPSSSLATRPTEEEEVVSKSPRFRFVKKRKTSSPERSTLAMETSEITTEYREPLTLPSTTSLPIVFLPHNRRRRVFAPRNFEGIRRNPIRTAPYGFDSSDMEVPMMTDEQIQNDIHDGTFPTYAELIKPVIPGDTTSLRELEEMENEKSEEVQIPHRHPPLPTLLNAPLDARPPAPQENEVRDMTKEINYLQDSIHHAMVHRYPSDEDSDPHTSSPRSNRRHKVLDELEVSASGHDLREEATDMSTTMPGSELPPPKSGYFQKLRKIFHSTRKILSQPPRVFFPKNVMRAAKTVRKAPARRPPIRRIAIHGVTQHRVAPLYIPKQNMANFFKRVGDVTGKETADLRRNLALQNEIAAPIIFPRTNKIFRNRQPMSFRRTRISGEANKNGRIPMHNVRPMRAKFLSRIRNTTTALPLMPKLTIFSRTTEYPIARDGGKLEGSTFRKWKSPFSEKTHGVKTHGIPPEHAPLSYLPVFTGHGEHRHRARHPVTVKKLKLKKKSRTEEPSSDDITRNYIAEHSAKLKINKISSEANHRFPGNHQKLPTTIAPTTTTQEPNLLEALSATLEKVVSRILTAVRPEVREQYIKPSLIQDRSKFHESFVTQSIPTRNSEFSNGAKTRVHKVIDNYPDSDTRYRRKQRTIRSSTMKKPDLHSGDTDKKNITRGNGMETVSEVEEKALHASGLRDTEAVGVASNQTTLNRSDDNIQNNKLSTKSTKQKKNVDAKLSSNHGRIDVSKKANRLESKNGIPKQGFREKKKKISKRTRVPVDSLRHSNSTSAEKKHSAVVEGKIKGANHFKVGKSSILKTPAHSSASQRPKKSHSRNKTMPMHRSSTKGRHPEVNGDGRSIVTQLVELPDLHRTFPSVVDNEVILKKKFELLLSKARRNGTYDLLNANAAEARPVVAEVTIIHSTTKNMTPISTSPGPSVPLQMTTISQVILNSRELKRIMRDEAPLDSRSPPKKDANATDSEESTALTTPIPTPSLVTTPSSTATETTDDLKKTLEKEREEREQMTTSSGSSQNKTESLHQENVEQRSHSVSTSSFNRSTPLDSLPVNNLKPTIVERKMMVEMVHEILNFISSPSFREHPKPIEEVIEDVLLKDIHKHQMREEELQKTLSTNERSSTTESSSTATTTTNMRKL